MVKKTTFITSTNRLLLLFQDNDELAYFKLAIQVKNMQHTFSELLELLCVPMHYIIFYSLFNFKPCLYINWLAPMKAAEIDGAVN